MEFQKQVHMIFYHFHGMYSIAFLSTNVFEDWFAILFNSLVVEYFESVFRHQYDVVGDLTIAMAKTTQFQCLSHPSHRWLLPPVAMVSKKHYIKKKWRFSIFKVHVEKPARVHFIPDLKVWALVSSPGEFHPQALSEPYVNLSIHTAPIIQP